MLSLRNLIAAFSFLLCSLNNAFADGGITIQGTRLIYPMDEKQLTFSIANTSPKDSFLVQSWVENQVGDKVKDLIVVPPLYLSGPNDENILRIILMNHKLPNDRESLYYYIAKGIPSIDKVAGHENNIRIALASRIKLFIRPSGLKPSPERAPANLIFSKNKKGITIKNPTPYYLTLTNIKYGKKEINSLMIKPFSNKTIPTEKITSSVISFSTINDYGAITLPINAKVL